MGHTTGATSSLTRGKRTFGEPNKKKGPPKRLCSPEPTQAEETKAYNLPHSGLQTRSSTRGRKRREARCSGRGRPQFYRTDYGWTMPQKAVLPAPLLARATCRKIGLWFPGRSMESQKTLELGLRDMSSGDPRWLKVPAQGKRNTLTAKISKGGKSLAQIRGQHNERSRQKYVY